MRCSTCDFYHNDNWCSFKGRPTKGTRTACEDDYCRRQEDYFKM